MTIKIHTALTVIITVGVLILLFSLIKGCANNRQAIAQSKELKIKNDSLEAKIFRDSIEAIENKKDHEIALELMNGQYDLVQNQKSAIENELAIAKDTIKRLVKKFKNWQYKDTPSILVPTDFVVDCKDCFNRIESEVERADKYQILVARSDSICDIKSNQFKKRITQQEQEKIKLSKSLQDCMDISKAAQKAGTPKGQLYFSWNVIWSPFPNAAAVGLLYQNKHKLQYGLRWGYGTFGQFVETEMNLPLSFKKR